VERKTFWARSKFHGWVSPRGWEGINSPGKREREREEVVVGREDDAARTTPSLLGGFPKVGK